MSDTPSPEWVSQVNHTLAELTRQVATLEARCDQAEDRADTVENYLERRLDDLSDRLTQKVDNIESDLWRASQRR